MIDTYVKAVKDELKHKITVNRKYRSLEKQEFANGLQQALDIIEKYERRDMRRRNENT